MDTLAAGPPSIGGLGGGGSDGSPCQTRDVREWQHLDPLTGDRLRARLQADRWIVGQAGRYDKVVDSRDVTAADGRLHSQHKQLEMLQARTAQGSVQVVRTRTVSSACWSSDHVPPPALPQSSVLDTDYDGLELQAPLNLSTQRERAEIGRSGSLATRRPPTRRRDKILHNTPEMTDTFREESPVSFNRVEMSDNKQSAEQKEIYRSNSTEDLSSLEKFNDEYEQVGEWRRVSKIRRSLQLRGKAATNTYTSKPIDLPSIPGCVSKIRQELENSTSVKQPVPIKYIRPKRHTFITMDSLLDVRGHLRKSLPVNEMTNSNKKSLEDENDDGIVVRGDLDSDVKSGPVRTYVYGMENAANNGTGSLETRRARDTEDWHARRKSYGFEGVLAAAPVSTSMVRSDTSTDSGICRSTELTNGLFDGRSTVVTLGQNFDRLNGVTTIPITLSKTSTPINNNEHGFYRQTSEDKNDTDKKDIADLAENEDDISSTKRGKKVEFCKTEVHFAADSGRVNIVETDGKPPPTQNFRRRRRITSIGSAMSPESKSNLPVIHFGDDEQNKLVPETSGEADSSFRNVVKVKPVRPRSFHMGDTTTSIGDSLWGVKLRHVSPVHNETLQNEIEQHSTFEKSSETSVIDNCQWSSVADRVRAVEHRRSLGFSTKVNFGSGEPIVESRGSIKGRTSQDWNNIHPAKPSSESSLPQLLVSHSDNKVEEIKSPTAHMNSIDDFPTENVKYIDKPKKIEIGPIPSIIERKDNLRRSLDRNNICSLKVSRSKSPRANSPRGKSPNSSSTRLSPIQKKSPLLGTPKTKIRREKSPNKSRSKSPNKSPNVRKSASSNKTPVSANIELKIPSTFSGSPYRQLRGRELAYFGVNSNNRISNNKSTAKTATSKNNDKVDDYVNISKPSDNLKTPINKQKIDKSLEKMKSPDTIKSKDTNAIYQNVTGITKLTNGVSNANKMNGDETLKVAEEIVITSNNHSGYNEKSPAITETPKGRGRERVLNDEGVQVSRGYRENQRRCQQNTSSKGLSPHTSPNKRSPSYPVALSSADSIDRPRTKRRSKESSASTLSPEKQNGVDASDLANSLKHLTMSSNQQDAHNQRTSRRHHIQRVSSREALLEATLDSSEDEQQIKDSGIIRRYRRHERSCDRRAPIPEYHHKTVTSTIKSVAEKAAAKSTKKISERHTRTEKNDYGNDVLI